MSHAKAARELGYQPRPFEQTVSETLEWFREAGLLDEAEPRLSLDSVSP